MAILNAQHIVEGGSYTPAAGENRVVVFAGYSDTAYETRYIQSLAFGSAIFSAVRNAASGNYPKGGIFYIKEADIPSGASTLTPDFGGEIHEPLTGVIYTLTGVDQAAPVFSSAYSGGSSLSEDAVTLSSTLDGMLIGVSAGDLASPSIMSAETINASTPTLTYDSGAQPANFTVGAFSAEISSAQSETISFIYSTVGSTQSRVQSAAAVFSPAIAPKPGIPSNTLEYQGSPVTAATATFSVHAGTDLKATSDYRIAGVALTNGVFSSVDLSGTTLAVGDPIVIAVKPSSGPGITLDATVGDIA